MFESTLDAEIPYAGAPGDEDWFDPAWGEEVPPLEGAEPIPVSACAPSGWLALELDHATADPGVLSDATLIDMIVGFDRVSSWAAARQAGLLAEFARRRPCDDAPPGRSDVPARYSGYAPDEVALALRLSRTAATTRLVMARVLVADLPATLAAWEAGTIDVLKARAITEAAYLLAPEQRGALEERVLPRAGIQTLSRLRAALARAVLVLDPEGAAERHARRRQDRRVVLNPDGDGMATLWALLSAPDATAAYQRLCQLARDLGAEDPRGMDARRADLLTDLLTGRRCAATATPLDHDDCDPESPYGCDCTPTEHTATTSGDPADPHTPDPHTPDPHTPDQGGHDCPTTHATATGAGAGPGKPLVSVIVPITTLMGLDDQPGDLIGHGPIPASLAREIAAEGTWRRLLTDPASGTLLDYGRSTYTPPDGLADFIRARDVYCRNPICGQRAATADLDHTIPWPEGPTSQHNLHGACRHDHLIKTFAPGWTVTQHPDGRVSWTTPTGHIYTSHPHDYRPDPHPPPPAAEASAGTPGAGAHSRTGTGHDPPTHDPDSDPPPF